MATVARGNDGKFLPKMANKPAIFSSNFRNLVLTMEPGEINREKGGGKSKKGKRIRFEPDGKYETKNADEINFLMEKSKHPTPFSRIKCVQEAEFGKEE